MSRSISHQLYTHFEQGDLHLYLCQASQWPFNICIFYVIVSINKLSEQAYYDMEHRNTIKKKLYVNRSNLECITSVKTSLSL